MRKTTNINDGWDFTKEGITQKVSLPHSWNALDSRDENYYRGECAYEKILPGFDGRSFIEINGANTVCEVYVNGAFVGRHENGYSMFRLEITDFLNPDLNVLRITVDNSPSAKLYPQTADFTFYGGLYRDVNIISGVGDSRFALLDKSRTGIYITPKIDGAVFIKSRVEGGKAGLLKEFEITDSDGNKVASTRVDAGEEVAKLKIENPVLWNGLKNPRLYTATARLIDGDELVDEVKDRFGLREFAFDSEKGFYLNGERLKLRGVCRHQDRENIGNALTLAEHKEDMELIKETGANSIRLAHYQHDSKFYDLCDETGTLVWAEIPVISKFSRKKQPQARLMLEELIRQNYNRPSIYCWGIGNEVSLAGFSAGLIDGVSELSRIARKLDPTRPAALAQQAFYPVDSKLNGVADILGYNHYFGWYFQTVEAIDEWLDDFHARRPDLKLCLSEYGAEAITTLHSASPVQGDYSEEYQALFHEHYIKAVNERDWLWGSYVWNMFDFGSAMRNEGGVRGRNDKGLVTMDRKIKKDAFYVYKAYWSDEKFVRIAGERFADRVAGKQKIKVYSNCGKTSLTVNGETFERSGDKILEFDAVIKLGENVITARSGDAVHEIKINGVASPNPAYSLPEDGKTFVRNWFAAGDGTDPGKLSLNDGLGDIIFNKEIQRLVKNHAKISLDSPLLKPLGKLRLKPLAKLASKLGAERYVSLANRFLQTIEKEKN